MPTWPLAPDWSEPWRETRVDPTDVIVSGNGTEKRVALRAADRPLRRVAFRCVSVSQTEAETVCALVEANQTAKWTLPDWHLSATPGTSRDGRLVAFDTLTVGRPMNFAAAFAVEFELDSVEGQT